MADNDTILHSQTVNPASNPHQPVTTSRSPLTATTTTWLPLLPFPSFPSNPSHDSLATEKAIRDLRSRLTPLVVQEPDDKESESGVDQENKNGGNENGGLNSIKEICDAASATIDVLRAVVGRGVRPAKQEKHVIDEKGLREASIGPAYDCGTGIDEVDHGNTGIREVDNGGTTIDEVHGMADAAKTEENAAEVLRDVAEAIFDPAVGWSNGIINSAGPPRWEHGLPSGLSWNQFVEHPATIAALDALEAETAAKRELKQAQATAEEHGETAVLEENDDTNEHEAEAVREDCEDELARLKTVLERKNEMKKEVDARLDGVGAVLTELTSGSLRRKSMSNGAEDA